MSEALLEIKSLNVYYGRSHVLQDVDLTVGDEPISLIGRNGMGKTTLCNAIMGLIPAASGSIVFDGAELTNRKTHWIAGQGLGYVPQGRRLFPSLTVAEHLRLVQRKGSANAWDLDRVYELFPPLADRRAFGASLLSGGEQQMLAIARALLLHPRLLVMDEPSEGLAPVIVDQLVEILQGLKEHGIGLLLIEQNLGVATSVSDRLAVMVGGRIALETTSERMLTDRDAQRQYLGVSPHGEEQEHED
ncbi:MAG: ABC transporter ATP-binding protein [Actinobacteria bacterium]|nr:ABC transporter ATP-binding protein [Actinomycetota bacterium]